MQEQENTTLPHSALNTHIGADANLGLLLLANGFDYFNFPGLIDAFLTKKNNKETEKKEDEVFLSVLYTGKPEEHVLEDAYLIDLVSPSGIYEAKYHANDDYKEHFLQLISERPDHIKPSLVDRMDEMLEKLKGVTPSQAVAIKEKQMVEAMEHAQKQAKGESPLGVVDPSNIAPASGTRKMQVEVNGTLPESATEGLKQHLREEAGSNIIIPK